MCLWIIQGFYGFQKLNFMVLNLFDAQILKHKNLTLHVLTVKAPNIAHLSILTSVA